MRSAARTPAGLKARHAGLRRRRSPAEGSPGERGLWGGECQALQGQGPETLPSQSDYQHLDGRGC